MSNIIDRTTRQAIAAALLNKKPEVIALMKKNGVIVSTSYTDRELIIALLQLIKKSDRFKKDFADLMSKNIGKPKFTGEGMFNFTGENMFRLSGVHPPNGWYGADGVDDSIYGLSPDTTSYDIPASSTTPAAPVPKTSTSSGSFLSGVFSSSTVSNILNNGLNVLSTSLTNKSNQGLADTALQIEQEKTKQAQLLAAAGQGGGAAKPGLSTGAKIGIGLGIAVAVGLLIWGGVALSRKSKAKAAAKATA